MLRDKTFRKSPTNDVYAGFKTTRPYSLTFFQAENKCGPPAEIRSQNPRSLLVLLPIHSFDEDLYLKRKKKKICVDSKR